MVFLHHLILNQRQHGISTSEVEDAYLRENNEQFQKSMDCALKYLKRLSEELGIDFE